MRIALTTLIDRSIRNMGAVHPVVKETALEVISRAYSEGINVQISSGYRSNEEQQRLFNQGRTTPGEIVTNARPGQSLHNYGLAVDYFLVSDDGKTSLWNVNSKWRRVAAIAKSLGFEWGGDWEGFKDYAHLQMTGGLTLSQLQSGRMPNLVSRVPVKPASVHLPPNIIGVATVTKDFVNLLDAPSNKGKVVGKVTKGTSWKVLEVNGDWYRISATAWLNNTNNSNAVFVKNINYNPNEGKRKQMEEINKINQRLDDIEKKLNFAGNVSDWAKKDWEEVRVNGYMDGTDPRRFVRREELAIVINRIRKNFLPLIKQNEIRNDDLEIAVKDLLEKVEELQNNAKNMGQ